MNVNKGDHVRLTEDIKQQLRDNGSFKHVAEFGECIGIVHEEVDWGPCYTPGPEVNVRWQPSNLRYAYLPEHLIVVECAEKQCQCKRTADIEESATC